MEVLSILKRCQPPVLIAPSADILKSLKVEEGSIPEEHSPTNINEEKRESGSAILKQLLSQKDDDDFEFQRERTLQRSLDAHKDDDDRVASEFCHA